MHVLIKNVYIHSEHKCHNYTMIINYKGGADMIEELLDKYSIVYGKEDYSGVYSAPGRVNLIGEHTDYNGGYVLPCGINLGTYGVVRKRQDKIINVFSENFRHDGIVRITPDMIINFRKTGWEDYVKAVIAVFREKGYIMPAGLDIYLNGSIPDGAGLSSSASLEVLIGTILNEEYQFSLSGTQIALMCQEAENRYIGCNCGIMDQFASAMGEKDHAIFLNTHTLKYRKIPFILESSSIVVTNSGVKHKLAESDYNLRREECGRALDILQSKTGINNLCDMTPEEFLGYEYLLSDATLRKRVKHVVYENYRTIKSSEILADNDIHSFGLLMNESHISLRDDYEVSCRELDILAEAAWNIPGVYGSRMTGGGFGGCTVSIVKNENIDYFKNKIYETYYKTTGKSAAFYIVKPGGGASKILDGGNI